MNIKINTNISSEYKETTITINAPKLSDEIRDFIKYISDMDSISNQIVASNNNEIYFINLEKIICFFSKDKYNYARTVDGTYKIKYKLYELENFLKQKNFIRISNSCIINTNQVKCFDTSILGTILVNLKDNTQEKVSKRKVPQIMKLLRERGNLK